MDNVQIKRTIRLLLPSVASGFTALFFALLLTGFAWVTAIYVGSYESVQLNSIQTGDLSDNKLIAWYQLTYDSIVLSNSLGAVSLFLFWSIVGMVSYMTVTGLIQGLREVNHIKDEVGYVHMDRKKLLREELQRLAVRVAALAVLFVTLRFVMKTVLPWGRELARVGATESSPLSTAMYLVSAVVIVGFAIHVVIVLVRLAALRTRLFGDELPEEDLGQHLA